MWQDLFKPTYLNWRRALCLSVGIYIHLFITFCEPYKGDKVTYIWDSTQAYILHSLYNFTHITLFCAFVLLFLPKYLPKYFLPENFTFQRFLFLTTATPLLIGLGFLLGNQYFFHHDITLFWFLLFFFKVTVTNMLFVGMPFVVVFLLIFTYFKRQNNPVITLINDFFDVPSTIISENRTFELPQTPPQYDSSELPVLAIHPKDETVEAPPQYNSSELPVLAIRSNYETVEAPPQYHPNSMPLIVHFTDTSNKKTLTIALDNLYYITSAQNYIEIIHRTKNAVPTRSVLRNSLKTIEEEMIMSTDSPLIRCHKAFIINREKVVEMRGTSKNAHFILADIEPSIPISRHKFLELEPYFSNLS